MAADTYSSFTPGEVADVFLALRYHLEEPPDNSGAAGPAAIRCRKGGITTLVQFCDPARAGDLYARVRLAADMELSDEARARLQHSFHTSAAADKVTVSVVHTFSGGVTLDWLKLRIQEWDAILQTSRRPARPEPQRRRSTPSTRTSRTTSPSRRA